MTELTVYELPPSPNNVRVRLALGWKDLAAKLVPIDPTDRSELVRISGQPLAPVLVHGERVVYDSHAILRYLEVAFPDAPRLYSADYEEMKAIEGWELWARTELSAPVGAIFGQFFAPERDPAAIAAANAGLAVQLEKVEQALAEHAFLTGAAPNAADVSVAALLSTTVVEADAYPGFELVAFFAEHFRLPASASRTAAWLEGLLAYDVARRQPA